MIANPAIRINWSIDNTMDKSRFDKGLAARREVLGEKYVDQAFENMDDFDRDFSNFASSAASACSRGPPPPSTTCRW